MFPLQMAFGNCHPSALHSKPTLPETSMNTEQKEDKSCQMEASYFSYKILQVITDNLLKIQEEEGRAGRNDLANTKQVVLEGSKIGKLS